MTDAWRFPLETLTIVLFVVGVVAVLAFVALRSEGAKDRAIHVSMWCLVLCVVLFFVLLLFRP